mgnify:FL=1
MKAFFYYAGHTLKNQIRKLMKTYVIVLLVCVVFGAVVGGLVGTFAEDSAEESVEVEEDASNDGDPALAANLFSLSCGGVILVVLLWNVVTAEKSGSGIFQMADVNLLFQAPMKPQSVLLFRLIFKMGGLMVAGLYLIFQIPNLYLNMGLPLGACIAALAVWGLTLVTAQLLSVLVYTVTATHVHLRKYILPAVVILCGAVALAFAAYWRSRGGDLLEGAFAFFNGRAAAFVPIWGWLKGVIDFSLAGQYPAAAGMGVLCLAFTAVLIVGIWRIRADFYEDAMAKSEETAAILAQTKEKGAVVTRKKDRSDRLLRGGSIGGSGAATLFYKNMYNRKRFARFGFATTAMIVYLLAAVLTVFVMKRMDVSGGMYWVIAVLGIMAYFRSLGNPLAAELKTSFFVTLPAGAYEKFWWTILSGSVSCFLDLLPAVAISALLLGQSAVLPAVAGILFIVSLDFFSANVGALADLSLPVSVSQGVKSIIQVVLVYVGMLPAVAILIIGLSFDAVPQALAGVALVDLLLGMVAFAVAPQFIKNGRR